LHPRILAFVLIVVAACADPATVPSNAPTVPIAGALPPASVQPTAVQTAPPTPAPSAVPPIVALTGEVAVTMTDAMRFAPDPITVKAGVPITFMVKNAGLTVHEFVVGTESEQADHAAEMAMGDMGHGHDNAISVQPGKKGTLTMTFTKAGDILVGCHEPGHYDAGMKATLSVVD
jgi:uncharacterized cupredoxin-like copper-binding protein